MSYNKFEMQSFGSKDNSITKKQLNEIWKQFMSSFGYQKYYCFIKEINNQQIKNIYNSTICITQNNSLNNSSISSIQLLFSFLEQNSITISENNNSYFLISNSKRGLSLLSDAKIWIMYIIFIDQKFNDNSNKIFIVMNLFKEAIKNNCDIISLFEFFLIYISKIDYEDFCTINSKKNILELLPKEFIALYIKKKSILKTIFNKDNSSNNFQYNYFSVSNDFINTQSTLFSTTDKQKKNDYFLNINEKNEEFHIEEEKNNKDNKDNKDNNNSNNECLDMNKIIVVCKDYLNKGYFVIFKDKKDLKDSAKNPFLIYDEVDEDENYYLMPLLNKYENYDQKIDANKVLTLINKSIYKNYTYYPYDVTIINRL
jgi:hypothetical protein